MTTKTIARPIVTITEIVECSGTRHIQCKCQSKEMSELRDELHRAKWLIRQLKSLINDERYS